MEQLKELGFLIVFFVLIYYLIRRLKSRSKAKGCLSLLLNTIFLLIITAAVSSLVWDFFTYHSFDNELKNRFENAQLKDVASIEIDEWQPGWERINLVDSVLVVTDSKNVKAIFNALKTREKLPFYLKNDHRNREWSARLRVNYLNNKLSEFKVSHVENGPTYFYLLRDENEFDGRYKSGVLILNETELNSYENNDLNFLLRQLTNYKGQKSYLD